MRNERFPPCSTRELDPAAWVDGAFPWGWDVLPGALVEHTHAVARSVEAELRGR